MLKPSEQAPSPNPERPVGELVNQLIEDGKTYAKAELAVAKAVAADKARSLAVPSGLLGAAFLLAQAAVTVLAVATFSVLQWALGSVLAGLAAFAIFAGLAGALAYVAINKLKGA